MGTRDDKVKLFELLYEARDVIPGEKAAAWDKFNAEVDRVRAGSCYSRSQVKEMLYNDGYWDYAKRRRITERPNL